MRNQTLLLSCPHCRREFSADHALEAEITLRATQELGERAVVIAAQVREVAQTEAAQARQQLEAALQDATARAAVLEAQQLEALHKVRDIEQRERSLELEVARRAGAEREEAVRGALTQVEEQYRLRDGAKDLEIEKLRTHIDNLKRSADSTIAVTLGDAGEIELGTRLAAQFPDDRFDKVLKGKRGGDWIQTADGRVRASETRLLWEAKNQKQLDKDWFPKARTDQYDAKADAVILVWYRMPNDHPTFLVRDGVLLIHPTLIEAVGTVVRDRVLAVRAIAATQENRESKETVVYDYICSSSFAQELERILSPLVDLQQSLDRQRLMLEKEHAKQMTLLGQAIRGGSRMVGTLQTLTNNTLPDIVTLALPPGPDL